MPLQHEAAPVPSPVARPVHRRHAIAPGIGDQRRREPRQLPQPLHLDRHPERFEAGALEHARHRVEAAGLLPEQAPMPHQTGQQVHRLVLQAAHRLQQRPLYSGIHTSSRVPAAAGSGTLHATAEATGCRDGIARKFYDTARPPGVSC